MASHDGPEVEAARQMVDFQSGTVEGSQASTRVPNHGRAVAVDFERVFETGEAWADAKASQVQVSKRATSVDRDS